MPTNIKVRLTQFGIAFGHVWCGFGQGAGWFRPKSGYVRPNLVWFRPSLARLRPNSGYVRPNVWTLRPKLVRLRPMLGHVEPNLVWLRPNLGHVRPNVGRLDKHRVSTNYELCSTQVWVVSTALGPLRPNLALAHFGPASACSSSVSIARWCNRNVCKAIQLKKRNVAPCRSVPPQPQPQFVMLEALLWQQ